MIEKRFVKYYTGRTKKRAIGIKDIENNRIYVTLDDNIRLLNELVDENEQLKQDNEGLKEKLCELGVSDVKINGKRIDTGLEEWLE